ncbi:Olfactory receptor 2T27 [Heterocephalus glaber]|uniref:Olfactory receptor 2T27 n=1 Tax=Heterocephalus glaber TaxID=10181 RepID=G5BUV0_HETGA|nr:Olfactory receptor 2T27 [Heterocephalus glaber]
MAYDHYMAVCTLLCYLVLMSQRFYLAGWLSEWLPGDPCHHAVPLVTIKFPFCTSQEINHFFCEVPMLLKLSFSDTLDYETAMYVCFILMLLIPCSAIWGAIYMYMLPHSYHTPEQDKAMSTFYTILTPMLNLLIYSLRNREMAGAMRKALG